MIFNKNFVHFDEGKHKKETLKKCLLQIVIMLIFFATRITS